MSGAAASRARVLPYADRLKLSKKRREQRSKARKQVYNISRSRNAELEAKRQRQEYRASLSSKRYVRQKSIPQTRKRVLPIRKVLGYRDRLDKLGARGALCRKSFKNLEIATPHFATLGVSVPTPFSFATYVSYNFEDRMYTYFQGTNGKFPAIDISTRFVPHNESSYARFLFSKKELAKLDNSPSAYKYVNFYYAALYEESRTVKWAHAMGLLIGPDSAYVIQSYSGGEFDALLRESLSKLIASVFGKPVVWAPEDVDVTVDINFQKSDRIFSKGECALWSIIIPYALCKYVVSKYGSISFLSDNTIKQFYEYANATWSFPDTYNEYAYELGIYDAST